MTCPSCDRDLSYPGAPGHECYTYEEWYRRQREGEEQKDLQQG